MATQARTIINRDPQQKALVFTLVRPKKSKTKNYDRFLFGEGGFPRATDLV